MKYGLWICLTLTIGLAIWFYPTLYPTQRTDRPVAGDVVQPSILPVGKWQTGAPAHLQIRLNVSGGAKLDLLTDVEVPAELLPEVQVRFYRGAEELPPAPPCKVERAC